MQIPLTYELLWVALPLMYIVPIALVLLVEVREGRSAFRIIVWVLIQLFLPLIGFVIWWFVRGARFLNLGAAKPH